MTRVRPRTNDRVLLGEFDSQQQRETLAGEGWVDALFDKDNPVLRQALGALRFELLLSQTVVITDAQAIDGRVLLGLAATGLLGDLRTDSDRPMPLELRSRSHDLPAVRAQILGKPTGSVSSFFSDSDELAGGIAEVMRGKGQISASELSPMLRSAGAEGQELAAVEECWAALDALTSGGALAPVLWENRDWGQCQSWADRAVPLNELAVSLGLSEEQVATVVELSKLPIRSDFRRNLTAQGWKPEDTAALNGWYDDRYNRATAFYQGADFRSFGQGKLGDYYRATSEREDQRLRRTEVQLPAGFIDGLGQLTYDEWVRAYAAARPHLRGWWSQARKSDLQQALEAVAPSLPGVPTPNSGRSGRLISLGVAIVGEVAALPLNFDPVGVAGVALMTVMAWGIDTVRKLPVVQVTDEFDETNRG